MTTLDDPTFAQAKTIFWGNFVLGLITFFSPFIHQITRYEVYWKIVEYFIINQNEISNEEEPIIVLILLVATFFWLPIMGYAFYRYTEKKRTYTISQRLINYFLFGVGSAIYILPIYIFLSSDRVGLSAFRWGYWLLLICTTIMLICYLIVQKAQLVDELDMSEHLIEDEK